MTTEQFGPFGWNAARREWSLDGQALPLNALQASVLSSLAARQDAHVSPRNLLGGRGGPQASEVQGLWSAVAAINQLLSSRSNGRWFVAYHPSDGFRLVAGGGVPAGAVRTPALAPPVPVIGRDEAVAGIRQLLTRRRFVTIVGPGGLGKTTVARVVAQECAGAYPDGVFLIDMSRLSDGSQALSAVGAAMGAVLVGPDPLSSLVAFVRGKKMLLLLDSCERVAEDAARIAEALLAADGAFHVLATSREALLAAGEWLFRLATLATPAPGQGLSGDACLAYPAVELFLQRVLQRDASFRPQAGDAERMASICRRLDGLPLAIEIVAARVPGMGLAELSRQMDEHLLRVEASDTQGPARHQTLAAMMDWTYERLRPAEQLALQRLSLFRGRFSMEAAAAVVRGPGIEPEQVAEAVVDLAERSLLAQPAPGLFRLLDTTRAYAATKLPADERERGSRRHAQFLFTLLRDAEADWLALDIHAWQAKYGEWVDDIRLALETCFAPGGDEQLGVELACASFEVARQMSMDAEFRQFMVRALGVLARRHPRDWVTEMMIHAHLGNLLHLVDPESSTHASLEEMLEPQQSHMSARMQIVVLSAINHASLMVADFARGTQWSERAMDAAGAAGDPFALVIAQRMLAQTRHFMGRHGEAEKLALAVLDAPGKIPLAYIPSTVDPRISMRLLLARVHWMQGKVRSALRWSEESLRYAAGDTSIARSQALAMAAIPLALWNREFERAAALVGSLRDVAQRHSLRYWLAWAERYELVLALRTADAAAPPDARLLETGPSHGNLRDHLCTFDARLAADDVLARVDAAVVGWCAPEVLRARAVRAMQPEQADPGAAERLLRDAVALSRRQGAPAWELRASTSLATLLQRTARGGEAQVLLACALAGFEPGEESADLRDARDLLSRLRSPH